MVNNQEEVIMAEGHIGYLEERKLVKRWNGPLPALVNLVFTLALFAVTWWIFQDPRGIMRFYTPYLGYYKYNRIEEKKLPNIYLEYRALKLLLPMYIL